MRNHFRVIGGQPIILGGGPHYLLDDEFITDRADAAAINGTAAEPGAGTRIAVANDGALAISSQTLVVTAQTTAADGDLFYVLNNAIARSTGATFEARVKRNGANTTVAIGWCSSTAGTLATRVHCFQINGSGLDVRADPTSNSVATGLPDLTYFTLKIKLLSTGCYYYYNGSLVATGVASTTSPVYPAIQGYSQNIVVDYIRVY